MPYQSREYECPLGQGEPIRAILRQLGPVERGYSLCALPNGGLAAGPVNTGTPTRVSVDVVCPPDTVFVGIYHTHPGGTNRPSAMDLEAARRSGAKVMCIRGEDGLKCWRTG